MSKEKLVIIKYVDEFNYVASETIPAKNYMRLKEQLEKLGYKVSKCDTNEKTTK